MHLVRNLPTVVELAASFQVGRSTIREALSGLKGNGVGRYSTWWRYFCTDPLPTDNSSLFDQGQTLQEVQEVRRFIEAGCASLAAVAVLNRI